MRPTRYYLGRQLTLPNDPSPIWWQILNCSLAMMGTLVDETKLSAGSGSAGAKGTGTSGAGGLQGSAAVG